MIKTHPQTQIPAFTGAVIEPLTQRIIVPAIGTPVNPDIPAISAEFSRLPRAKERCPISGASRSWLIETNAELPPEDQFLVRVRRRGCLRGVVFISIPKLSKFIRGVQAGAIAGFTAEAK